MSIFTARNFGIQILTCTNQASGSFHPHRRAGRLLCACGKWAMSWDVTRSKIV